ncbi:MULTISPECIES: hypothetical protein [Bacillus cereus group]|uniref:Uncharacterized protein n=1 Tax=Bacillus proteolyticus TaxID=2026192 RepID=A0ABV3I939_9BACI|nr:MULTISPECIES: hypothetical protein [Bacillus cereus group]MBJ8103579.1 hypothetical protein [Bacillus cereus group sp. N8]MED1509025.1 hypothetical protein [Bacillus proteolyticus]
MSYDTIASLQRMQQLEQAQAVNGKRVVLKRINSTLDIWLIVIGVLLAVPTLSFSLMLYGFYFGIKEIFTKTYLVQNVATGEKFKVDKNEFKQYKKSFKKKEKQVRRISDL